MIAHFLLGLNSIPLFGCTTVCLSIHLPKGIMVAPSFDNYEYTAATITLCSFVWTWLLSPLGWKPRHVTAWSYGNKMLSFVRNHQIVFQSECTVLHFYQQWLRVAVASYSHKHLVISVFWILAILMVSHRFNLHFPSNIWCEAFFHMLICHPEIFFGEVSINIFGSFFKWIVCFSVTEF